MKLVKFSFLLLLSLMFASCNPDDDDNEGGTMTSVTLEGRWAAETLEANNSTRVVGNGMNASSVVSITGISFDYTLEFSGNRWAAEGGYDLNVNTEIDSSAFLSTNSRSNVNNQGGFSTSSNEIIFDGSFYSLEFSGQPAVGLNWMQTTTFSIAGDLLTIVQPEIITSTEANGFTTIDKSSSISTWRRQ